MSKTISFVATDKLAEWLEEESERRMTTISSTAQQLLAEKYREEQGEENSSTREVSESSIEESREDDPEPDVFERHPDAWYEPASEKHDFAVYTQEGGRKYYKTRRGAAQRLKTEYENA